eukprot:3943354-Lingulodinium_polyedra.AAC.1
MLSGRSVAPKQRFYVAAKKIAPSAKEWEQKLAIEGGLGGFKAERVSFAELLGQHERSEEPALN